MRLGGHEALTLAECWADTMQYHGDCHTDGLLATEEGSHLCIASYVEPEKFIDLMRTATSEVAIVGEMLRMMRPQTARATLGGGWLHLV